MTPYQRGFEAAMNMCKAQRAEDAVDAHAAADLARAAITRIKTYVTALEVENARLRAELADTNKEMMPGALAQQWVVEHNVTRAEIAQLREGLEVVVACGDVAAVLVARAALASGKVTS